MRLKLYLFLLAFISLNFANATYFIQVTNIDPLTGAATYMLNETSNPLQLPISFCAFGSSQPQIATNYKISWYRNTTNSTTNGVLISEMVVSTLAQVNVQDVKTHLPDTSIGGTYYYYAVLSEPSSTGCGMTDSLTSTTQKVEIFNPATHLNFDGSNDYIELANESNFDFTTEMTIEFWMNSNYANPEQWDGLITKGDDSWRLHLNSSGTVNFACTGTTITTEDNSATVVTDGNWHHIAATLGNNTVRLYIDGVEESTSAAPEALNNSSFPVSIGQNLQQGGRFYLGNIEDVRIWNIARTAEQINGSRNCELQGTETGLVAYYNFNQGIDDQDNTASTTLFDQTVNGNNGTLTNFSLTGLVSNWKAGSPVMTGSVIPNTPMVTTPIYYSQNSSATALTATSSGTGLLWYSTETGGSSLTEAPTPNTDTVGSTSYWVSSTNANGCESERTEIVVNVLEPATHLNLEGSNDYVDCGDDSSLQITGNTITLEAYVNFNSFASAPFLGNIINKDDTGNDSGYMLRAGGNGIVNFVVGNGVWNETFSPANSITENTWHHIAGVYNGTTAKIYVDGIEVASQSFSITIGNATKNLMLGKDSSYSDRFLDASIDDVRIWNVARTADQINGSKNCELQGTETGLVAYYKCNQGNTAADNTAITTLTDASAHSNNGVLTNFALTGTSSNWMAGSPVITGSVIPTLPTVTSPIVYNEGDTASELTAASGGTGLMWFTTETGGAGDVNAPTPNTDTVGSTSYWVASSNINGCESERVEIVVTVEETLGVNDNTMVKDIVIYPNPTHGLLTINNNKGIDMQVTIYDINGRVLISKSNNDTMTTLDMTNFSNGIYLLRIQTESGDFSKKVIKN
ncbi:MAG: T9SS type A sorting domain-containing protein [Bizionia sp.]|nr:T9SS type A sorting domain-containing protein [Bizionia sp.]